MTYAPSLPLHPHQPDLVPLRVGEERDLAVRDVHRAHRALAAERLRLRQRGLDVVDLDVEGDVTRIALGRLADAAGDAAVLRFDGRIRHFGHVGQLPPEELRVEALQSLEIL